MTRFSITGQGKAKADANEFCVKEKAIEMLGERQKCAARADRFVNFVFEKCKIDYAPFSSAGSRRQVKNFTNIL